MSRIANEDTCYHHRPDVVVPLQAIELGDGFRAAATTLADVPNLDAALAAGVNVFSGIRNCHGADHLAVCERVYLTCVTRYAGADKSVLRERHRLHLPFTRHVKTVRTATKKEIISLSCNEPRYEHEAICYKEKNTHGLPPGTSGPSGALMLA